MMLTALLILGLAAAQPSPQHSRARDGGSLSTIGMPTHTYGEARAADRIICLRNEARRQNECRTRAEWARIAAAMPRNPR